MARVSYSMGVSLDGYIKDADDNFDWTAPDDELHRYYNEQAPRDPGLPVRPTGLRGDGAVLARRGPGPDAGRDRGRVRPDLRRYPAVRLLGHAEGGLGGRPARAPRGGRAEVTRLKEADGGRLGIGGAGLAASLFDLIDEFELRVHPVLVGGGTPYFPPLRDQADLRFVGSRTMSGVVLLRYERAEVGS